MWDLFRKSVEFRDSLHWDFLKEGYRAEVGIDYYDDRCYQFLTVEEKVDGVKQLPERKEEEKKKQSIRERVKNILWLFRRRGYKSIIYWKIYDDKDQAVATIRKDLGWP